MSHEATPFALAYPRNGHVNHIIIDQPKNRHPYHQHITYTRALCGVSGRDSWGTGFMIIRQGEITDAECSKCRNLAAKRLAKKADQ